MAVTTSRPCAVRPRRSAFQAGSIGVALSGRDTGSSQLFVTLGRYPHLDGQYAWLGRPVRAGIAWLRATGFCTSA